MADNPNELAISEEMQRDKMALTEFWTAEALAEATPIEVDIDGGPQPVAMLAEEERPLEGDVVSNMPVMPDRLETADYDPQPACPASGPNTEQVPDRTVIPYSPVGKLFMTFEGQKFVGSAWTIAGSGVFTAGHCVYDEDRGGFADNLLFIPQYHKGAEPRGRWAGIQIATLKGWSEDRNFEYDLAAFTVDRPIQPFTGSLGWIANAGAPDGCVTGIGYPAGPPFDGQEMWRSTGQSLPDAKYQRAYNDMTGGCSGGPWEIWREGVPLTTGVNSFRWSAGPNDEMYSPFFGKGFLNLWNWVK